MPCLHLDAVHLIKMGTASVRFQDACDISHRSWNRRRRQ